MENAHLQSYSTFYAVVREMFISNPIVLFRSDSNLCHAPLQISLGVCLLNDPLQISFGLGYMLGWRLGRLSITFNHFLH